MMDHESESGISLVPTINQVAAKNMLDHAEGVALRLNLSGYVTIFSRTGMQEAALALGTQGTPMNVAVALDKIKTVLNTRRSTSLQRERMEGRGYDRDDLAGQIGSLLSGGLAILHNDQFVGAIAFSGGTPEEDQEFCLQVIQASGFGSDLLPPPPRASE